MTTTTKTTMTLIRIETENYGWVVSRHRSEETARRAYDRKMRALPEGALGHLMYCVTDIDAPVEARVRHSGHHI